MAVIHVAKINYITSGHLETHLFTRNKHTCTRHPSIANMRFHFFYNFKMLYLVVSRNSNLHVTRQR